MSKEIVNPFLPICIDPATGLAKIPKGYTFQAEPPRSHSSRLWLRFKDRKDNLVEMEEIPATASEALLQTATLVMVAEAAHVWQESQEIPPNELATILKRFK